MKAKLELEMPENCDECDMYYWKIPASEPCCYAMNKQTFIGTGVDWRKERAPFCPLVEV